MAKTTPSRGAAKHRPARPLLFQLRDHHLTPKAAEACVAWVSRHGIDTDFTMGQLAEHGECATTTICRAKKHLFAAGFMVEVRPAVFHGSRHKENLAAVYRFTEAFYQVVFSARRRRANRPSPGAFRKVEGTAKNCTSQHAHSLAKAVVPVPVEESSAVEVLVKEAGLRVGGARVVAERLADVPVEVLPHLVEVAKEVASKRRVRDTQESLLVGILRSKDPALLSEAKNRHQQHLDRLSRVTARGAWEALQGAFRAHPRAMEAYATWLVARDLHGRMREDSSGYLEAVDQLQQTQFALVSVALEAAGEEGAKILAEVDLHLVGLKPQSLVWKRARNHHIAREILAWAGINLGAI